MRVMVWTGLFLLAWPALPQGEPRTQRDITYATVGERELQLDLYLPPINDDRDAAEPPLVVWVHGGAWMKGSRHPCPMRFLTGHGFAVASVSYRFAQDAVFPAQLHDCKAAVRFLRANAEQYGYDAERIGVAGGSAGGHLVALLGTTGNAPQVEGDIGDFDDTSSAVACVYNLFGPTDLINLDDDSERGRRFPSPIAILLGADPDDRPDLAAAADPATYLDETDAPMLLVHGTDDPLVPLSQSEYLAEKLEAAGVEHELVVVEGAGHGGRAFKTPQRLAEAVAFFDKHLRAEPAER